MCENCLINQISLGLSEQKESSTDFKDIESLYPSARWEKVMWTTR